MAIQVRKFDSPLTSPFALVEILVTDSGKVILGGLILAEPTAVELYRKLITALCTCGPDSDSLENINCPIHSIKEIEWLEKI